MTPAEHTGNRTSRAAAGASAVVEGHQLYKTVRDEAGHAATILSGVSISVHRGDFVALTGASGSGKSSLLYLLGLLDRPSHGALRLNGLDTMQLDDDGRARLRRQWLGFVFQFHFLLPELSVLENVALPIRRSRSVEKAAAMEAAHSTLSMLGLGALVDRKPAQLSGGQQQRVAIARAVANRPVLILADEPTGSLDSVNAEGVFELFAELAARRQTSIVMVTHEAEFARRAQRRIELRDGRVIGDTQSGARTAFASTSEDPVPTDRKLQ